MLTTVDVENYRGFRRYTLKGLSRVNLLVGRNNAGKTALLESIHLLASGGDPVVMVDTARRRGEEVVVTDRDPPVGFDLLPDLSHFFHGHKVSEGTKFSIRPNNDPASVDEPAPVDAEIGKASMTEMREFFLPEGRTSRLPTLALRIGARKGASDPPITIPLTEEGTSLLALPTALMRRRPRRGGTVSSSRARFITPDSLGTASMAGMWDQLITASRESEVIRAMGVLDPRIDSIAFLSGERSYSERSGIMMGFKGGDGRVPLGSCGDGMRRLLAIALSVITSSKGFLIVDEIDTGFHYSVMADLWRLVIRTATELNVQVFATTHSYDCIRGLAQACREDERLQPEVSLNKIDPKLESSVPFSGGEIITASEHDIEVR